MIIKERMKREVTDEVFEFIFKEWSRPRLI